MALYKNLLHHPGNLLPKWLVETIGVYVSLLNGCAYNRTVLGLGVTTLGDTLGLSPGDADVAGNWRHT